MPSASFSCIVSNFYIKSQLSLLDSFFEESCIVSNFYIKSQPKPTALALAVRCIVSNFYIKSQPRYYFEKIYSVV